MTISVKIMKGGDMYSYNRKTNKRKTKKADTIVSRKNNKILSMSVLW